MEEWTPQDLLAEATKLEKFFRGFAQAKAVAERLVDAEAEFQALTHRRDGLLQETGTLAQTKTDLERKVVEAQAVHDQAISTLATAVLNARRDAESRIVAYQDSITSWSSKTTKAEAEYTERCTTLRSEYESTLSLLKAEQKRQVDAAQNTLDRLTRQIAQAEDSRREALEALQR